MITRKDITNTLPVGILENGEFTPDAAGLAVHLSGYYTLGELLSIVEDLKHVDSVYKAKLCNIQAATGRAFEMWQRGEGSEQAAKDCAEAYGVDRWAVQDLLRDLISTYFKKH